LVYSGFSAKPPRATAFVSALNGLVDEPKLFLGAKEGVLYTAELPSYYFGMVIAENILEGVPVIPALSVDFAAISLKTGDKYDQNNASNHPQLMPNRIYSVRCCPEKLPIENNNEELSRSHSFD
jgi:hypothetical protein